MHLEFDHIALTLGGKRILDDVSFEVHDREFVSVLGESGAGKSTTLKVVAGLMFQDEGQVRFDGTCVDDLPTHKRGCAIVFQDIRLFPNMNARDNVAFPLKMQHVCKAERHREADELLAAVQLEGMGTAASTSFPEASSSALPWRVRWRESRARCCLTSRSVVWTNNCATTCVRWSSTFIGASA